jgi:hypothetical protein
MDSTTDVPIILTDEYAQKCADAIVEVIVARAGLVKIRETESVSEQEQTDEARVSCDWAVAKGLFVGDGKGNFDWKGPITREQVAIVLYRLLGK